MLSNAYGSRQPDTQGECYLQGTKLPSYLDATYMGMSESDFNCLLAGVKYQRKTHVFNQQGRKLNEGK